MVNLFKSVFDEAMFLDVHYVNENPAVVKTVYVEKRDGQIHAEEKIETFNLVTNDGTTHSLKNSFFVRLNFQWYKEVIKYNSFLSRIFPAKRYKKLLDTVTQSDWAIVSSKVLSELRLAGDLREVEACDVEIKHVGDILGTEIYLIPSDIESSHGSYNIFYTGLRKSITPIVHTTENRYYFHVNDNPDIKKYELR